MGEEARSLYMGVHYINNACETFVKGRDCDRAAKRNNALAEDTGIVKAVKKIAPDSEIMLGYGKREHNYPRSKKRKK